MMPVKTLQCIVGIFFILLGIAGISPNINESVFSINNNRYFIEVIFGVTELVCGSIMIIGLFSYIRRSMMYRACMVVFVFWIARMLFSMIIWGMPSYFNADIGVRWLMILTTDAIVASAIWLLAHTYKR